MRVVGGREYAVEGEASWGISVIAGHEAVALAFSATERACFL